MTEDQALSYEDIEGELLALQRVTERPGAPQNFSSLSRSPEVEKRLKSQTKFKDLADLFESVKFPWTSDKLLLSAQTAKELMIGGFGSNLTQVDNFLQPEHIRITERGLRPDVPGEWYEISLQELLNYIFEWTGYETERWRMSRAISTLVKQFEEFPDPEVNLGMMKREIAMKQAYRPEVWVGEVYESIYSLMLLMQLTRFVEKFLDWIKRVKDNREIAALQYREVRLNLVRLSEFAAFYKKKYVDRKDEVLQSFKEAIAVLNEGYRQGKLDAQQRLQVVEQP